MEENIIDFAKRLFPGATDEEIDFLLWEKTCFPFDNAKAVEQLEELAKEHVENVFED